MLFSYIHSFIIIIHPFNFLLYRLHALSSSHSYLLHSWKVQRVLLNHHHQKQRERNDQDWHQSVESFRWDREKKLMEWKETNMNHKLVPSKERIRCISIIITRKCWRSCRFIRCIIWGIWSRFTFLWSWFWWTSSRKLEFSLLVIIFYACIILYEMIWNFWGYDVDANKFVEVILMRIFRRSNLRNMEKITIAESQARS